MQKVSVRAEIEQLVYILEDDQEGRYYYYGLARLPDDCYIWATKSLCRTVDPHHLHVRYACRCPVSIFYL